jgi:hypothetical protein
MAKKFIYVSYIFYVKYCIKLINTVYIVYAIWTVYTHGNPKDKQNQENSAGFALCTQCTSESQLISSLFPCTTQIEDVNKYLPGRFHPIPMYDSALPDTQP